MKKTRVLIADDHPVVRRGVIALLESHEDLEVCGEAATGREAVESAARLKPDVIVMDIAMPEMNGLEAARHILRDHPNIEILILTMHESEELVRNVLDVGARGYVLKNDITDSLAMAVRALARHQLYMTSKVSDVVLRGYLRVPSTGSDLPDIPSQSITPREREIVQLLAEGHSNKEVANLLGISIKTVETHRAHIMAKLNLHSISDLVRYAIRNHITES
jgi:DNA-binding NarL/FixJ family response regulator